MITDTPNARWQREGNGVCAKRQQRFHDQWEAGGQGLSLLSADEVDRERTRADEDEFEFVGSHRRGHRERTRSPLPRPRLKSQIRDDRRDDRDVADRPVAPRREAPSQRCGQGPGPVAARQM